MEKFYKISVPKPCHEDWNKMTPESQGRFCKSCKKTVIDFTKMSPLQIQDFLADNEDKKLCGRFIKTQLDTVHLSIPITIFKRKHSFNKVFLLALLIVMGTTLINCTNHKGKQQKIETINYVEASPRARHSLEFLTSLTTDSIPTEPFIEKVKEFEKSEEDISLTMGLMIPERITDLNQPVPGNLITIFPALIGTPIEKRTSENFQELISKIVTTHFDTALGNDLGLHGIQRIYVQYVIDKNGEIKNIKIRAPHPRLEKETARMLKKVPKLTPGIYQNTPVRSLYQLPIVFKIEE